jgi:hypothetical protein
VIRDYAPEVRVSTWAASIAGLAALILGVIATRAILGSAGDEDLRPWLWATLVAVGAGTVGVPLAIAQASRLPRWQWLAESLVSASAIVLAVLLFVAFVVW